MRVELRKDNLSSNNHGPLAASTAHPVHRLPALAPIRCNIISTLVRAGISTSQILTTLCALDPDVPLIRKDISHLIRRLGLKS
jgi:hypothetical protein